MAGVNPSPAALAGSTENDGAEGTPEPSPPKMSDVDSASAKLRLRWEFASVLNFLHVFHPIIGKDLKLSAEDVETAIIEQNSTLAQLHIALLEVAEGDFPLTGAKGEEISVYKGLEPTARVVILKALCEVRADQYDAGSYINEKMKNGTDISYFRKGKLASDGNRVAIWYDGNETIGHRLYKEVNFFKNRQAKNKDTVPAVNCQWETLATNLEEFNKIVNEFSSSKFKWEIALGKSVEMDVIPVLVKQKKKKEKELYRKQREQSIWNGFRSSVATRSCRSNKPVDYRFDKYDRDIAEAIKNTNKRKTSEDQVPEEKPRQKRIVQTSDGSNKSSTTSMDSESTETDTDKCNLEESDNAGDSIDEEYVENEEDDVKKDEDGDERKVHRLKQNMSLVHRSKGSCFNKRLAGVPGHTVPESTSLGSKTRLRQRPSVNTAAETTVVADSEDEGSLGETS